MAQTDTTPDEHGQPRDRRGEWRSGFDALVFGDAREVKNDKLMHYLHHRYHTVNFGENAMPLDKWFGSLHDGTPEADLRFKAARVKG